jgi:SOS-response transcriptional repressor LexA
MKNERLGERIQRLRKEAGYTPYRLGQLSKIDPGYIARIESGTIKKPGIPILKKLAGGLETSLFNLIGEEESTEERTPLVTAEADKFTQLKRVLNKFDLKELSLIGKVMLVPERGYVQAGRPAVADQEEGPDLIVFRKVIEAITDRPGDVYALRIAGESLSGDGIHTDDVILVLPVQEMDLEGKLYIIKDPGSGERALRHLSHRAGRIRVYASDPKYQPLLLDEVEVIGRVLYIQPQGREA